MKKIGCILIFLLLAFVSEAQPANCTFKPPQLTINFGTGDIREVNNSPLTDYRRVFHSCPTDGHYAFAPYTSRCFSDDWHTLSTDHTGDAGGNMLLVNAAPFGGEFLSMTINGLKNNTMYELGLWVINLCRPTKKCPFLLLPSLHIRLVTPEGKIVANIVSRDLPRVEEPNWTQHRAYFTTPASSSTLLLIMSNNARGGCGNDFALDDITFRECVKQPPPPPVAQKTPLTKTPPAKTPLTAKRVTDPKPATKPGTKKVTTAPQKKVPPPRVIKPAPQAVKPKPDTISKAVVVVKQPPKTILPIPLVLRTRENALVRKIDTEEGEIKIDLYDNGEIDDDTVSIYHNNQLVRSHMRLSQRPISITIKVDTSQPHHELVMVAENLGSIPPNTSVMIITTPGNRYEVFISSSEQKNAKVLFDLKH